VGLHLVLCCGDAEGRDHRDISLKENQMKKLLLLILFTALPVLAQSSTPCGVSPTPGQPHVCLSWQASATPGVTYNVYRATTSKGENYSTPLNAQPLSTLFFYDTTVAVGTQYFYTVTAGQGGTTSVPTPEVGAQVPVPDSAPTLPVATAD
jgi:hypothetical protein